MELNQLKYFCTAAKYEHITEASEILHIAQPALTQSIKRLSDELGVPLFIKKGRNIKLTEFGKYLYKQSSTIIDIIETIPTEIKTMSEDTRNTVHINMPAASLITTEAIISYQKNNPNIQFRVYQQISDIDSCDINILTTDGNNKKITTNIYEQIFSENIFLAMPKNKKNLPKKALSLSDAKNENFISLTGSKEFRKICDKLCLKAGFTPHIVFESDSPASVRDLISADAGIGFWPEYSWGNLDSGSMVLVPIINPQAKRNIIISFNTNKMQSECAYKFFIYLCSFFSKRVFSKKDLI